MDRTERRQTPADPLELTPDRKLHCLCSWLERANQRESYAVHASLILPISALAIGATLAAALLGMDSPRIAMGMMTLALVSAYVGFLIHRRRCQIWGSVARRVQTEQRLLIDEARKTEWALTGRVTPDRLAEVFAKETPIRFFTTDALSLYLAALVITVLFALFTLSESTAYDSRRLLSQEAPSAPPAAKPDVKPVF